MKKSKQMDFCLQTKLSNFLREGHFIAYKLCFNREPTISEIQMLNDFIIGPVQGNRSDEHELDEEAAQMVIRNAMKVWNNIGMMQDLSEKTE